MPGVKGRSGGRNAKTVAQHHLTHTYRPDRHGNRRNPDPPAGPPVRPAALTGAAAAEWDRVIARLAASQSLAIVDDAALVQYCRLHELAERLQAEVDALPTLTVDGHIHPAVTQVRHARLAVLRYLVELGLTPAARGRVQLPPTARPDDPFAEFDEPLPLKRVAMT